MVPFADMFNHHY